jgi:large subunit ribosomal protein L20
MSRVKRGKVATKKRKKILSYTKGFMWGRKDKERLAREALLHAWTNAFRGRKEKKRDMRALWQVKINAAARLHGIKYSAFIAALKKNNVILDRKILADLAEHEPKAFEAVIAQVKK